MKVTLSGVALFAEDRGSNGKTSRVLYFRQPGETGIQDAYVTDESVVLPAQGESFEADAVTFHSRFNGGSVAVRLEAIRPARVAAKASA